jgi:hypothetical protein
MDKRIAQDQASIKALTCPVCSLCFANREDLKDRQKSLRQHIARNKDPQHMMWCTLNWRVHFVRGGYRFVPKQHTVAEVIELVEYCFGHELASRLTEVEMQQT